LATEDQEIDREEKEFKIVNTSQNEIKIKKKQFSSDNFNQTSVISKSLNKNIEIAYK
jgi:hypothetical protein